MTPPIDVKGTHAMELQYAFRRTIVIVTNHWVAVRGNWFCDRGVPVKIADAPHRRKRVRFVYVVTVAPIRTQPRADRLGPKSAAPR